VRAEEGCKNAEAHSHRATKNFECTNGICPSLTYFVCKFVVDGQP